MSNLTASTADGFLATVIGLACFNHATGELDGYRMHMRGASEIVRLRGGFQTIEKNNWICLVMFWTDVSGSNTIDRPPLFPIPYKTLTELPVLDAIASSPQLTAIYASWKSLYPHQPEVMILLLQIAAFTRHITNEVIRTSGKTYTDGNFATIYILPLMHRLLAFASPEMSLGTEGDRVLQAVRLSCSLYFTEIRRLFGVMGIHTSVQTFKLRLMLLDTKSGWAGLELLRMWCLSMGGLESIGMEREWYLEMLTLARQEMRLDTWEEVERELSAVVWYKDVHSLMFGEFVTGKPQFSTGHLLGGSRFGGYRPVMTPPGNLE